MKVGIAACGLLVTLASACGSPSSLSITKSASTTAESTAPHSPHAQSTPPPPAPTSATPAACQPPALFAPLDASRAVSAHTLVSKLKGKYRIDQIHVFHRADSVDGRYFGAFYGRAMHPPGGRGPDLLFECQETPPDAPVFLSTVKLEIPLVVHAPSGRVTTFDERPTDMDDPRFNAPAVAEISFDSLGHRAYLSSTDRLGDPPYLSHRHLWDWTPYFPSKADFYLRSDGIDGFEIRFEGSETRNAETSAALKATYSVVVTYRRSDNP